MQSLALHHVAINVRDLEVSADFYERAFGLQRMTRPPFRVDGIWYACGDREIHLIRWNGTFRASTEVDVNDIHLALRTNDFEGAVAHLIGMGFDPDLPKGDSQRMHLNRESTAGYPQLYILDPDLNLIEVNGARI